jgi:catechol 2,3-dioxygenase-like lactoylglutathione lyase family enzyme
MTAAHIHSLLHCNINSSDLKAAAPFYEDVLGQVVGMRTTADPVDGAALGMTGMNTTLVWFFYDARGPRSAPAIELMDWLDPAPIGAAPTELHHAGLAAVGYVVPSLADVRSRALDAGYRVAGDGDWPLGSSVQPVVQLLDADGVFVELHEGDVPSPQFSHLRISVRDLEASTRWYGLIGFLPVDHHDEAKVGEGVVTVASLRPLADPSLSLELTAWSSPEVTGSPIGPANHVGIYRIALAVDDVAAARAELAAILPDVPEPIWVPLPGTKLGGVTVLFLTDPDGVVVELVERPRKAMTARS